MLRNNGSHWDSTNHKFVAPVDGVYMFNLNWLSYSGSAVMDCSIAKNGTYIAHSVHPNLSGVASSNHNTTTLSISYYLDANDEIDVRGNAFSGNSTNGIYGDSNYWTTFNGFLVDNNMTSILKVSEIQDPANNNSALTIDSTGRVKTPARPFIQLFRNANASYAANALITDWRVNDSRGITPQVV